jgi:hypothetical protein
MMASIGKRNGVGVLLGFEVQGFEHSGSGAVII